MVADSKNRGAALTNSDEKKLLAEIAHLRDDLKQLREIVNVLVNVVMEEDYDDDEQEFPAFSGNDSKFQIYN